ncbi:MAG TPA: hypothetical protein VIT67_14575 [Povalibacter sp.]
MNHPAVQLRLLGPMRLLKEGIEIALPASRKVRGLLALLAVSGASLSRARICELLCDTSGDPRGELRWCLSRLRTVIDDPDRQRLNASGDTVALDLSDCDVDVHDIARRRNAGELPDVAQLRALNELYAGEFAAGLELDRNPTFASWLSAQRRQFRAEHVDVLAQLAARLGDDDPKQSFACLEHWLQLSPFDARAHELLLRQLSRAGRVQEADSHLAATIRLFEAEGLDWMPIRECWRAARGSSADVVQLLPEKSVVSSPADNVARRASICVMPFTDRTAGAGDAGGPAAWLTEDIITRLAKLRVLFVIARGSVFALCERNIPPQEAARLLNVDYVASGSVRQHHGRIEVMAQLAEAATGRIVWADDVSQRADAPFDVLDDLGNRIVASLAGQIEIAERNRAVLKPPNSLDAWEAYHRGLWHMYRFNAQDNRQAAHYFQLAVRQDRTFARAHAGLSFTHFQNVFLHWSADRDGEIGRACATAGDSLAADDLDPAAHWAMGRALWLRGNLDDSLLELERSVTLSPNFALGHYTLGFVQGQSGDAARAIESTDMSRDLSPFDPLMFAMLASRAIALFRLQRYAEAAQWASRAALRPNAHVNVQAIAAHCLAAAGRMDEALVLVGTLRRTAPDYQLGDFLRAFQFAPDAVESFRHYARRIGLDG